jgi:hypothetical protein
MGIMAILSESADGFSYHTIARTVVAHLTVCKNIPFVVIAVSSV